MSLEQTEAVVLRGVDFSESSRIVTFLTPDRGKMACMARGIKRPKNQLGPLLETFNCLELVYYWKDGRSVQQLSEATLIDSWNGIKTDLDKITYGAFPLEIAYKVAHENEPSPELYNTLVQGFKSLCAWQGDVRFHVGWQVLQLLNISGFEPALEWCVECGGEIGRVPGFSYGGGVTCYKCRSDRRMSSEEYETLQNCSKETEQCPDVVSCDIFRLLKLYAIKQLETSFKSVRVIEQMFD